jgi:hypothetical protein
MNELELIQNNINLFDLKTSDFTNIFIETYIYSDDRLKFMKLHAKLSDIIVDGLILIDNICKNINSYNKEFIISYYKYMKVINGIDPDKVFDVKLYEIKNNLINDIEITIAKRNSSKQKLYVLRANIINFQTTELDYDKHKYDKLIEIYEYDYKQAKEDYDRLFFLYHILKKLFENFNLTNLIKLDNINYNLIE